MRSGVRLQERDIDDILLNHIWKVTIAIALAIGAGRRTCSATSASSPAD